MAAARVKFDASRYRFVVDGSEEIQVHDDGVTGSRELAGPILLSSLRDALVRFLRHIDGPRGEARLRVGLSDVSLFDNELGPFERATLVVDDGEMFLDVAVMNGGEPDVTSVEPVLAPLLCRNGAKLVREDIEDYSGAYELSVRISWPITRRTVEDMLQLGADVEALLGAANGGELTPTTALDLLRARRWELFRGLPESRWIDVKRKPYNTSAPTWKYEMAKGVAAFANSAEGGLVVLGMWSKDAGDGDTIVGHQEFELRAVKRQTYRNAVAQHVYPALEGFEVERIAGTTPGRGLVVLIVPPQAPGSRPFLVAGVVRSRSVLGAHVLVPVRREDETVLLDISAVHARLRLGEQVIRGTLDVRSPSDDPD